MQMNPVTCQLRFAIAESNHMFNTKINPTIYIHQLKQESKTLNNWISKTKQELSLAPEGSLHVSTKKYGTCFYHINHNLNQIKPVETYIRAENKKLIEALAMKDYNQKLLRDLLKQKMTIDRFLRNYNPQAVQDVYRHLSKARQALVAPIIEPDEEYIRRWESQEYVRKGFAPDAPEIYTDRGDRVRSKSEKMIADKLLQLTVPYRYECPIYLEGYGEVWPDFTLLDIYRRMVIYLEHLGKMDDPEYAAKALKKVALYERNGIILGKNLIITYETSQRPLDMRLVETKIKQTLYL